MSDTNRVNAQKISNKLSKLYNLAKARFVVVQLENCQNNSSDCGMFVILISKLISENLLENSSLILEHLQDQISPSEVLKERQRILQLIDDLLYNCVPHF